MGPASPELEQLRAQLQRWQRCRRSNNMRCSSGIAALDECLPEGSVPQGALVEWLAATEASGATTLAFQMARSACANKQSLVIVDQNEEFYPPSAAVWAVDLEQTLVVRPASRQDQVWALVQALRCPAVGAVLCWQPPSDVPTLRRLQLAAETGGTLGLLLRPIAARHQPSFAALRLLVEPLPQRGPRRVRVTLLGTQPSELQLEIDDETCHVRVAAELADPTSVGRAFGA